MPSAPPGPQARLTLATPVAEAGDTVSVALSIECDQALQAFEGTIGYDPEAWSFLGLDRGRGETSALAFLSAKPDPVSKRIRLGGVADLHLRQILAAGPHPLGRLRFLVLKPARVRLDRLEVSRWMTVDPGLHASAPAEGATMELSSAWAPGSGELTTVQVRMPNPYRPRTPLSLAAPERSPATARIYDIQGRLVRTLYQGPLGPTPLSLSWDGRLDSGLEAGEGVYCLQVLAGTRRAEQKFLLMR